MNRIVCIGNSLFASDSAGPRVYAHLLRSVTSEPVEIIDGGIAGLNLLPCFDNAERVVFVDTAVGFGDAPVTVLTPEQITASEPESGFGHGAGLPWLLRAESALRNDSQRPHVRIVGVVADASCQTIAAAAQTALRLARTEVMA